jgi:prepilin-type N-terminal cleavage/methylation domain-containing protein
MIVITPHKGFTLVEVIITLTLSSLVTIGISAWGISEYVLAQTRSDKETILTSLLEARAESQNGLCDENSCTNGAAHGVYFQPTSATLFEGVSFDQRNKEFDVPFTLSGKGTFSGDTEIVFNAITGNNSKDSSVQYLIGSTTNTFLVSMNGQISYVSL